MSFQLAAPVPGIQTISVLPSPAFNDREAGRRTVESQRAMDGTLRTYVKSSERQKLSYTFNLTRMKALELRAFIRSYYRATIQITNHKGDVWHVKFVSDPFEFETVSRAGGQPGNERVSITLELEGTKVSDGPNNLC